MKNYKGYCSMAERWVEFQAYSLSQAKYINKGLSRITELK